MSEQPPATTTFAPARADDLVAEFLAGRRPTTLRSYRGALAAFASWSGLDATGPAVRELLAAGQGDAHRIVWRFRSWLVDEGYAPSTVNARLAALRSLVRLARMQGIVSWTLDIRNLPSEPYRDTRGPGRRGVRALLEQVADPQTPREFRDRALVRMLTDLALRRAELVGIDTDDVDLDQKIVFIRGKGRHGKQPLTLPDPTADALARWLEVRGDEPGPVFVGLVPGRPRTRLTGTSVARIVKRLGAAAGVERARPHGLRHAAITQALEMTRGDFRAVQRFSRHADPRTLLLYDDARQDKAGEVAKLVAAWR